MIKKAAGLEVPLAQSKSKFPIQSVWSDKISILEQRPMFYSRVGLKKVICPM